MKLTIMRGAPGSGKTTLARSLGGYRVNRDDLRAMMFNKEHGTTSEEVAVSVAESAMVRSLLKAGCDVVVDACHVNNRSVERWRRIGRSYGADVEVAIVNPTLDVCLARNAARDRQVPEDVLIKMYKRLQDSLPEG